MIAAFGMVTGGQIADLLPEGNVMQVEAGSRKQIIKVKNKVEEIISPLYKAVEFRVELKISSYLYYDLMLGKSYPIYSLDIILDDNTIIEGDIDHSTISSAYEKQYIESIINEIEYAVNSYIEYLTEENRIIN